MKKVFCMLLLWAPLAAWANINLTNITDIQSLSPQDVTFKGDDNCTYFGNTRSRDYKDGVMITRKVCADKSETLSTRAYLTELKQGESPVPLVPAGSGWILKDGAQRSQSH